MWKDREYDNIKDAIFDAKEMIRDAKKTGRTYEIAAQKHLQKILLETKKMGKQEPDLKKYFKDLV